MLATLMLPRFGQLVRGSFRCVYVSLGKPTDMFADVTTEIRTVDCELASKMAVFFAKSTESD